MIFYSTKPKKLPHKIKMGGVPIEFEDKSVKYLGVHLDNSLKFETHVNEKIKSARKALYAARSKVKKEPLAPTLVASSGSTRGWLSQ